MLSPLKRQSSAQTTSPLGSTFWVWGNSKLMVKVTLAPVRVGESFATLKITLPPAGRRQEKQSCSSFPLLRWFQWIHLSRSLCSEGLRPSRPGTSWRSMTDNGPGGFLALTERQIHAFLFLVSCLCEYAEGFHQISVMWLSAETAAGFSWFNVSEMKHESKESQLKSGNDNKQICLE